MLSLTLLGNARGRVVFNPWRSQVQTELEQLPREQLLLLRRLVPPVGDFPDFLTPLQAHQGIEAGIDAVLSVSRRRLHRELTDLPGLPSWIRPLANGDSQGLARLGRALRDYHRHAIAPYESRMRTLVDAERAVRARALLDHGSQGLLADLGPSMRWKPPILEVTYPLQRDLYLSGRGLLLIPSAFCWQVPVTLINSELPPVLVYPLPRTPGWWAGPTGNDHPRALARLLGPTRAACLRVIEDGCTNGELARRTGTAPATASQHASILREADLITTTRHHNTVLHTLTPLGAALLHATPRP
ncbi:ArsR/SmtB family transcription factor [Streptomyces chilikensis]|uniref:ArsR/SmtB family transcription factor n=1 Tax=Streptomyces chilikensis TaxID=1194079 RepID=UPI001F0FCC47|nr:winged helix-turn-helix domain-containing protein [Streptomyces chilikensis]